MMEEVGVVSPQLRSFLLLDVSALRDYTRNPLLAPDLRIHDAQHPRCKTIPSTWLSCSTWPTVPFSVLANFFQPIVKTEFLFPHHIHKSVFHKSLVIILFRKFSSSLTRSRSFWQMAVQLSLWSCVRSHGTNFETTWCISNFVVRISWHPFDMLHCSAIAFTVKWWSHKPIITKE
jgi:hypothetical protein